MKLIQLLKSFFFKFLSLKKKINTFFNTFFSSLVFKFFKIFLKFFMFL